ncbi:MAG: HindVP family restriction endonuclease [Aureispira sp.]
MNKQPSLFGIKYSNRDFTKKQSWGKNQFNSSFPAALTAYLYHLNLECIYLVLDKQLNVKHQTIAVEIFLGEIPTSENIFYAFETQHTPYQQLVIGTLPRVDLVIQSKENGRCLTPIEIKLTALPDHTTCNLEENNYGSEIVVRPDTIVYLACSMAQKLKTLPIEHLDLTKYSSIKDWTIANNVLPFLNHFVADLDAICELLLNNQTPLVLQPTWKTKGKTPLLAQNCLDCFVWSNLAFTRLFVDIVKHELTNRNQRISRNGRTLIWLFKMLHDFILLGQFDHKTIIDKLSYNTKNDKAFAINGKATHKYMKCAELTIPRIKKSAIKKIILGGGQKLLSPERRFDAIIVNDSKIFE